MDRQTTHISYMFSTWWCSIHHSDFVKHRSRWDACWAFRFYTIRWCHIQYQNTEYFQTKWQKQVIFAYFGLNFSKMLRQDTIASNLTLVNTIVICSLYSVTTWYRHNDQLMVKLKISWSWSWMEIVFWGVFPFEVFFALKEASVTTGSLTKSFWEKSYLSAWYEQKQFP